MCACVLCIWVWALPLEQASESCQQLDGWFGNVCRSCRNGQPLLISGEEAKEVKREREKEEQVEKVEVVDKAQSIHFSTPSPINLSIHSSWEKINGMEI